MGNYPPAPDHCAGGLFMPWGTRVGLMWTFLLSLLLLTSVTVRVTRLFTEDRLLQAWRDWWLTRYGAGSLTAYLWWCPWCLSVWVGALASVPLVIWTPAPGIPWLIQWAGAAAFMSLASGVFATLTYDDESEA